VTDVAASMKRLVAVPRYWKERGRTALVLIERLVVAFGTFKQVYPDDGDRRRMSGSKGGRLYCRVGARA